MPAFLVAVYSYPDRATATADTIQSVLADSCVHAIHDTPPVVLGGLVKGGEIASFDDWRRRVLQGSEEVVLADATGRAITGTTARAFREVERRGALPITWYTYEAP